MAVWFNSEVGNFKLKNRNKLKGWINKIITIHGSTPGSINYIFTNDPSLLRLNKKYLGHDSYTDIISFDYSNENFVSGDIYISVERVKENSEIYRTGFDHELKRVIIHGILHFLGYKDSSVEEKAVMRQKETHALENVKDLVIT